MVSSAHYTVEWLDAIAMMSAAQPMLKDSNKGTMNGTQIVFGAQMVQAIKTLVQSVTPAAGDWSWHDACFCGQELQLIGLRETDINSNS